MFHEAKFTQNLDQKMFKGPYYQHEESFAVLLSVFVDVADRHAPLTQKTVSGSNAFFMTSEQLSKAIRDHP